MHYARRECHYTVSLLISGVGVWNGGMERAEQQTRMNTHRAKNKKKTMEPWISSTRRKIGDTPCSVWGPKQMIERSTYDGPLDTRLSTRYTMDHSSITPDLSRRISLESFDYTWNEPQLTRTKPTPTLDTTAQRDSFTSPHLTPPHQTYLQHDNFTLTGCRKLRGAEAQVARDVGIHHDSSDG